MSENIEYTNSIELPDMSSDTVDSASANNSTIVIRDSVIYTKDSSGVERSSNVIRISQTAHGFTLTNNIPIPVFINGSNEWQASLANDKVTLSGAFVTKIIDINTLEIKTGGQITHAPSHGLVVGNYYFLSETNAGEVVVDDPTGRYSDVCFYVMDANNLNLKDNRLIDLETIQKWYIKTTNTDIVRDYDRTVFTEVLATGQTIVNERPDYYQVTGNGIEVLKSRTYDLEFYFHFFQSGINDRKRLGGQVFINGVASGPTFYSGYGRGSNSDQNWGFWAKDTLVLAENDIITFQVFRSTTDGTGTITIPAAGEGYFKVSLR